VGELPVEDSDDSDDDDSEEEDDEATDDSRDDTTQGEVGHCRRLHQAIADRIAEETDKSTSTDDWLLRYLRSNGWWVRAGTLNLDSEGSAYTVCWASSLS
jgi:hypothetical protein